MSDTDSAAQPVPATPSPLEILPSDRLRDRLTDRLDGARSKRAARFSRVGRVVLVLAGAALSSLSARDAAAQLQYTNTTFLNGYASDSTIWTRRYPDLGVPTPQEYLAQSVVLRTVGNPNVNDSFTYYPQRSRVVPFFVSGTQHVLVGHSLGALIARGLYVDNAVPAPNITGIVAVAAPHQGAPLADNAETTRRFFADVQRRVNAGLAAASIPFEILAFFSPPNLRPIFVEFASFVIQKTSGQNINLDNLLSLTMVPVLPDLRPDSAVIQSLNRNLADAAIPHANIYGSIPLKYATLRLKLAGENNDAGFDAAVSKQKDGLTLFKACKYVGYGTIIGGGAARKCAYAAKVLKRVDDRWVLYVNGADANGRPKQVPFDGVVPNERSRYPGGLTNLKYDQLVPGANHLNIYKTQQGLREVANGMLRIGMQSVAGSGALAASVSGLDQVNEGSSSTWTAEATGGTPPYSYSWSGLLSGSGSSISGTLWSSGDLYLQVTDAAGTQVTAAKYITVTSGSGCPGSQIIC